MDNYKMALHDDIGVDVDEVFMQKKLAERAIRMMMFYMLEVQLKNAFGYLRDQTRRVANARIENAAALINKIGRGMIARYKFRTLMRLMRERVQKDLKNGRNTARIENMMAKILTKNIRRYSRMCVVKRNLNYRRKATIIQKRIRGVLGRIRVDRLRNWNAWLKKNAILVQCSFRYVS